MKSRKNDSFFNRKEIDEENLTPISSGSNRMALNLCNLGIPVMKVMDMPSKTTSRMGRECICCSNETVISHP